MDGRGLHPGRDDRDERGVNSRHVSPGRDAPPGPSSVPGRREATSQSITATGSSHTLSMRHPFTSGRDGRGLHPGRDERGVNSRHVRPGRDAPPGPSPVPSQREATSQSITTTDSSHKLSIGHPFTFGRDGRGLHPGRDDRDEQRLASPPTAHLHRSSRPSPGVTHLRDRPRSQADGRLPFGPSPRPVPVKRAHSAGGCAAYATGRAEQKACDTTWDAPLSVTCVSHCSPIRSAHFNRSRPAGSIACSTSLISLKPAADGSA